MTQLDKILAEAVLRKVRGLTLRQGIVRLFELGFISRRTCERQAVRDEVTRLERTGIARCDAFEAAARRLCCSYEKARNLFYENQKNNA